MSEPPVESHSKLKKTQLLFPSPVTLNQGQGHHNWYEHIMLIRDCYHQADFQTSHLNSIRENTNIKVWAKSRLESIYDLPQTEKP